MALPTKFHQTLNNDNYYRWVRRQLEGAMTREEVEKALKRIRDSLEKGETPWETCP